MARQFTEEEFHAYVERQYGKQSADVIRQADAWIRRGDGAAIYENHDLGHPDQGLCRITSFGSPSAQIEADEPPELLPDIGNQINWRYVLVGTFRKNQQRIGLVHDE